MLPRFGACQASSSVSENGSLSTGPIGWGWALTYSRDYDTPLGTYYADVQRGPGYEFRLARAVSDYTAVRLSYAHYGMNFEPRTEFELVRAVSDQVIGTRLTEAQLDVRTLTVGAQYHRWIDRFRRNRKQIYFSMDVGLARHTTSGNVTIWTAGTDGEVITYHASKDDDHAMLRTGGGFIFPVRDHLQVDVGADIALIWVRENGIEDVRKVIYGIKGYIFRLTAGLTWTI